MVLELLGALEGTPEPPLWGSSDRLRRPEEPL